MTKSDTPSCGMSGQKIFNRHEIIQQHIFLYLILIKNINHYAEQITELLNIFSQNTFEVGLPIAICNQQ